MHSTPCCPTTRMTRDIVTSLHRVYSGHREGQTDGRMFGGRPRGARLRSLYVRLHAAASGQWSGRQARAGPRTSVSSILDTEVRGWAVVIRKQRRRRITTDRPSVRRNRSTDGRGRPALRSWFIAGGGRRLAECGRAGGLAWSVCE